MGEVILPLADGEVPKHTIFDRRFVIECCETFHLHWRNMRLELSAENFVKLVETLEKAIATWRAHGCPPEHHHLELSKFMMDVDDVVKPTELGVELCRNLYRDYRETHGADAEFWEEDAFVHFHYRDMRFEMSIEDFLAFSQTMAEGRETLLAARLRPIEELFETLDRHNILYVVLRNWENLPEAVEVGPHSDLDLLVHPAHVAQLDALWGGERTFDDPTRVQRRVPVLGPNGEQSYILVDVRSTDDGYMPEDFSHRLLARRVPHKMFHVLPPREYFLSLLYHVVAHKGVMANDYAARLVDLAARAELDYPADQVNDFRVAARILADHSIEISAPDDATVLPKMPFIESLENVAYSRLLTQMGGRRLESRVHFLGDGAERLVRKQATADLAEREHAFLSRLDSRHFPRPLDLTSGPDYTVLDMEWIEGPTLAGSAGPFDEEQAQRLVRGCIEILAELRAAEITHRDIGANNIILRDGEPVLIDFGWALAPDLPCATPVELGGEGRAPEGFCDVHAMGVALTPVADEHPALIPLVRAMTAPAEDRVTDPAALLEMLSAPAPDAAELADEAPGIATRLIERGLAERAEQTIERVFGPSPAAAPAASALGIAKLAAGRPADAEPLFRSALADGPREDAATGLADTALQLGRPGESRELLDGLGTAAPAVSLVVLPGAGVNGLLTTLAALSHARRTGQAELLVLAGDDEADGLLRRARALGLLRIVPNAGDIGDAVRDAALAARAPQVALLRAGSVPAGDWLETLRAAAGDVGVVGSRVLDADSDLLHGGIELPLVGRACWVGPELPGGDAMALESGERAAVAIDGMLLSAELARSAPAAATVADLALGLSLESWSQGLPVSYRHDAVVMHVTPPSDWDAESEELRAAWDRRRRDWVGAASLTPWDERRLASAARVTGIEGARGFSTLAFADELVSDPDLLAAYAASFGQDDDATLVIYAPDSEPEAVAEELTAAMTAAGLGDSDSPDLLAIVLPSDPAREIGLAHGVDALLSGGEPREPFASATRFDQAGVPHLRRLAETRWAKAAA
jgi:hypothetical protein